jgi:phage terminase small subunit
MPGPPPKDERTRQRRNKTSTRSRLEPEPKRTKVPELHKRTGDRPWHTMTTRWWNVIWQSPMAPRWLNADVQGLFRLAELVDSYWYEPTKELSSEIRILEAEFGLTPMARRRLQWHVIEEDEEQDKEDDVPLGRPKSKKPLRGRNLSKQYDMRRMLQVVK